MATMISSDSQESDDQIPGRLLANDPDIINTIPTIDNDDHEEKGDSVAKEPRVTAQFEIQIRTGLKDFNHPIHENITLAAAARSNGFNSDGKWSNQRLDSLPTPQYELIRGAFFNDDPNCQIFEDNPLKNRSMSFALAVKYGIDFASADFGTLDKNNLLYRSHYGNLQFIHGMGSAKGEAPLETQRKIKVWLQAMYLVYSGQNSVSPDTLLKDSGLCEFFNDTNGHGSTTFKHLLMGRTPSFKEPNISLRALGSCMHIVEDSFAKGHCRRDDDGAGAISNFHCYDGQNHTEHSHWDSTTGALDPTNLDSFNGMYGARRAIDRCIQLLDAVSSKDPWNDKLEKWFQGTFAVSLTASNSDTSI